MREAIAWDVRRRFRPSRIREVFGVLAENGTHVRPSYRELRENSIAQEPGENKSKVPRDNWPSNSHGKGDLFGEANNSNNTVNNETLAGAVGTLSLNNGDEGMHSKRQEFDCQREYALAHELFHVSELARKETASAEEGR